MGIRGTGNLIRKGRRRGGLEVRSGELDIRRKNKDRRRYKRRKERRKRQRKQKSNGEKRKRKRKLKMMKRTDGIWKASAKGGDAKEGRKGRRVTERSNPRGISREWRVPDGAFFSSSDMSGAG